MREKSIREFWREGSYDLTDVFKDHTSCYIDSRMCYIDNSLIHTSSGFQGVDLG